MTIGSLRTAIHNRDHSLTPTQLHSAEVVAVAAAVIFGLVGIGLWLWMAYANKAGRNWARITSTVFFGIDTISLLAGLRQAEPVLTRVVSIVIWLIGLAAIVLLWRKESSELRRHVTGRARRPVLGPPGQGQGTLGVLAGQDVAGDRGRGDDVDGVHATGHRRGAHRDADGLVGNAAPAGGQPVPLGA